MCQAACAEREMMKSKSAESARRALHVGVAVLSAAVIGCATRRGADATLLDVPFCSQEADHCGCAALEMVMRHHGLSPDRARIEQSVHMPALGGTTAGLLAEAARDAGLDARVARGSLTDLKSLLATNIPPIVFLRYKIEDSKGHFVVVTGVAGSGRRIRFHSGENANRWMDADGFVDLWEAGRFMTIQVRSGKNTPGPAGRKPTDGISIEKEEEI